MRFLFAFIAFLWALPAYAGAVLVPMPPLLADGTTAGTVRLYVAGVANPRVKVKSDDGKVGPVVAAADGTVTFPFTPERATAVGTVALSVTMGTEITTVNVPVVPTFSGDLSVTFDPPFVPSTTSATVRVTPSQQSAVAAERRRFLLTASVGTVEAPVPSGNGTWIARYTPPKGMTTPTNVVFAAADASAPDAVYGYGLLPVTVRRSVSFDAPAGSSNLLTVGDRSYGPLPAAPSGKVAFDVDVDPRFLQGKLTTIAADGSKQEKSVDLPDAGKAQVAILSIGPVVPAGGSSRVRLVVFQPGGKEHTDTSVKLTVSAGAISEPKYSGGAYEATFTAPGTAGDVTLTAEADGVKVEQKLKVVAAAGSVTLTSDPAEIPAGATSIKLVARVKDGTGTAVTGKVPVFTILSGGTLSGTPKDNGDGSYTATVKLTSGTNLLRAAVSPQLPVSGAAPVRLVAWPAASIVAANGKDEVTVNVVALDPYGLPVPNVDLKLGVPMGDGSLPPSASTGASGVARVTYKAGTSAGLGAVHVEGAGLAADLPLYQTTDGMGPTLPVAGPPDIEAAIARWQGAAPTTSVIRTGTAPLAGPPAAVSVATVPPYTTPGAAILVTVRVLDAAGKGVPSQKLTVTASPGTAGSITDNHDGSYVLPVQLPAGVDGPLTISVGAASATGSVVLPTLANAAAASGSQATRTTGPTTGGTTTGGGGGAKTTQAAAVSDHAKLRLGAALVNARGSYEQTGNGGSQLLGAASFTTPGAGFFGINADASFWFVNADWGSLGLDARGHAQLEMFKLLDDPYLNVQRDIIAGARYRRGEGALSFTGGLGFHYTTGVLFRYSDAALSDAVLLNFPLYGARLAAGGMLEVGKTYAILELAETFAPFPVDTHAEGLVEYQVSTIGVRGGLTWDYRTMKFGTDDGGEAKVKQSQVSVVVGVGYKL